MSVLDNAADKVKGYVHSATARVRTKIFGANNERLDFLMDSFYKLSPEQRTLALGGGVAALAIFVVVALVLYFASVNALKRDLEQSFSAIHELQDLKADYSHETKRFDKLVDTVRSRSSQIKVKPFFEKVAKDLDVQIEGLTEQKGALPAENPLSTQLQEVRVELRYPKISIPRLLSYLVEVEKSGGVLTVQDLTIRGHYGTKLYFDGQAKVRGYSAVNEP